MADVAVNGTYPPHQSYAGMDSQHQYNPGAHAQNAAPPPHSANPPASTSTPAPSSQPEIPKDEVGWYFVEQYYTTLSRSPEKLYLFYNKRSQFVSGQETDKVPICVGQRAINDKIKELDFQDCKVRVTNVDSQASDSNIVIQVIGEISNKSQPHKKFTQTFVLATQTNGYFVLNDIFRYIVDEEDEVEPEPAQAAEEAQQAPAAVETGFQEPAPSVEAGEQKGLSNSADPAVVEHDAKVVDDEITKKLLEPEAKSEPVAVNGAAAEEEAPAAAAAEPEEVAPAVEATKDEKPETPEPTPAASPPKQAPAQPAAPPKPALPKTWASLAASANKVAMPAAPAAPAQSAAQPRAPAAPAAKPQAAAPTSGQAPTAPAAQRDESPAAGQSDEWTAVGSSHARQQSRQVAQPEGPQNRAYIKNVFENVDAKELRTRLEQFGELAYLDISRAKNCAFVDFKTAEGYNAAIAANPHEISGERLFVEERKTRQGQPPFAPSQRGQFQGTRGGRGGANQGPQRGAFQGGRGGSNFQPRGGRGGTSSPRGGRGGAQAA